MPITLAQLLPPVTADQAKALLLETLQGIGPVQQIGNGAGVAVISGAPVAAYDGIIQISTGGAPGTAAFIYSLDGGNTFSAPQAISGSGVYNAVGTGLVFNFSGTLALGDQYLFQTIFPPFPITDWESGGVARTLLESDAVSIADLAGNAIPDIAGGGLVDYATSDWLTLLSDQVYENDRYNPTATQGLVVLTLAVAAPTLTINPGDIVVANSSGSGLGVYLFSNSTGTTLTAGNSIALNFIAQQPGSAYNLSNGVLTVLKTPKPGLSVNNPAPGISAVVHSGGGSGTVTAAGTPLGNFSVVIQITASGGLGVGAFQVSVDGGSNFSSPLTIPPSGSYAVPLPSGTAETGADVTFAGTFTSGDTYSFTAYSSWVLISGQDEESVIALQGRDKNKWSGLGLGGGTSATFDYLARSAPGGGSEVVKTSVAASLANPGQINLVVAGANGPVSSAALSAIQTYVASLTGLTAKTNTSNVSQQTVNIVAQVFVRAAQLAAAQAAISTAFAELAAATHIGGVLTAASCEAALFQTTAGVTDVFMTSPTPNTDIQLPDATVPLFNLAGISYVLV